MTLHCWAVLLAVVAVAAASDHSCEELSKTVEDQKKLHGKWILHAATADCETKVQELKTINSSWIHLSPLGEGRDLVLSYGDHWGGQCYFGTVNATNNGNVTEATFHHNSTSHTHVGRHVASCPDSVIWLDFGATDDKTSCRSVYLFTKTGTLEDSHKEYFKKQLECLNFKLDLLFWQSKELCHEDAAVTEEKKEETDSSSPA